MKCLITGGAGFIGSHLSEYLLERGESVMIVDDLSTGSTKNLEVFIDHENLKLYHLASAVGVRLIMEEPVKTIETIFRGTDIVLRYAARYRKKIFIASTSEVYGKSNDGPLREDGDRVEGATHLHRWAYACAKSLDEFLALAHAKVSGLPVVVGRLFNTVGPRQSSQYGMVLPRFVEAAILGQTLTVHGDGTQTRCFCHVQDIVRALYLLMMNRNCENQVFNIGSNEEIAIYDPLKE
jgi:UDP-glucose 4-epimerase